MNNFEEMALRIEQECYAQGRSVNQMTKRAKIGSTTIARMRGTKQGPTAYTIAAICRALGKDPNWLFEWEENT